MGILLIISICFNVFGLLVLHNVSRDRDSAIRAIQVLAADQVNAVGEFKQLLEDLNEI